MLKSTIRPIVRNSLTREGLVFVVVLGFVAVCAILRNVNMLVVVSGMMFAPLLLCWRLSRHAVRQITVARVLPSRIHVGQPSNIQWSATNSSRLTAFNIRLNDTIHQTVSRNGRERSTRKRRDQISEGTVQFEKIPADETAYSSYRVRFAERGVYRLGPATVACQFPLPLVRCWFRARQVSEVHVAPRLVKLAPKWEQAIFSLATGMESPSRHRGPHEEEFFAIRKWRSGDNMRKIHWRSTAKYQQPMVRQFDGWNDRDLAIVLDLFADPNSIERSIDAVVADCEWILCCSATLVSRWSEAKIGNLTLAIAGEDTSVLSSRDQIDFVTAALQKLAIARTTSQPKIAGLTLYTLKVISRSSPVLVLSPRQRPVQLDLPPACDSRITWLSCREPEFKLLFSAADVDAPIERDRWLRNLVAEP